MKQNEISKDSTVAAHAQPLNPARDTFLPFKPVSLKNIGTSPP